METPPPSTPHMSAREAAEALDISLATLYSYVSRGLLHSESEGNTRSRRYLRADVEALQRRKAERQEPAKAAEGALRFGAPVLESALTLIADGRLYYRGCDAVELAASRSAEAVAMGLWTGDWDAPFPTRRPWPDAERRQAFAALAQGLLPIDAFAAALPLFGADDPAGFDVRPSAVVQTGARLLRLFVALATGDWEGDRPLAESLARAWAPDEPAARRCFDAALVLTADHEFNVSAFTARCVASAGSPPYAVVSAGLAALQGPKHGGHCPRVEALVREAATPEGVRHSLVSRLRRGEAIPGFGHPLYPAGDPRGRALLALAREVRPDAPAVALGEALVAEAAALMGEHPTVDLGLVVLTRALGLPDGSALALFAMGRTIGWIGHAIEQYQLDTLIRPRARYVGPAPN